MAKLLSKKNTRSLFSLVCLLCLLYLCYLFFKPALFEGLDVEDYKQKLDNLCSHFKDKCNNKFQQNSDVNTKSGNGPNPNSDN